MTTYTYILLALLAGSLAFLVIAIRHALKDNSEMDAQDKSISETDEMLHAWWETGKDWEEQNKNN